MGEMFEQIFGELQYCFCEWCLMNAVVYKDCCVFVCSDSLYDFCLCLFGILCAQVHMSNVKFGCT